MLFRQTLRYLVFIAWILGACGTAAFSADFKYLGQDKTVYTPYGYQPVTHVFSLRGMLQVGDSKKIRAALAPLLKTTNVFCETDKPAIVYLNSTGGSFF